jgi:surface antigen
VATFAAICGSVASGGCSYQLNSFFSKDDADGDQTGSIGRPGDQGTAAEVSPLPEADLTFARAAALDALAHSGKDASVPWQNPQTGAGGNITPLATSYSEGGLPCRDFLASYVHGESQAWLQGAACRTNQGKWEVKTLRTLKSS